MLQAGIAFLAGSGVALALASLPDVAVLAAALAALAALTRLLRRNWRVPALASAGAVWVLINAVGQFADRLPRADEGRDLRVVGTVASVPARRGGATRFLFDPVSLPGQRLPRRVRLAWYREAPPLAAGERWALTVRLKRPRGLANPGGFDYEAWLFRNRVGALGYVRRAPDNRRLAAAEGAWVERARAALAARIAAGDYARGELLNALVTGLRGDMSERQWSVLRHTGTAHLFAISGLHVGLAAVLGHLLGGASWRWLPGLAGRLARPRLAAMGALAAALAYAALAGFSVSTQRALIMLAAWLGAALWGRGVRPGAALGAGLVGVLLWDPWAPLALGFWLSFAAVAALGWLLAGRVAASSTRPARALAFVRVQWGLTVLLAPLALLFFQRSPLLGSVANLFAVPVVSLVSVPAALSGAVLAALEAPVNPALWLADRSLAGVWWGLERLAAWPGAQWEAAAPGALALLSALAGGLLLTLPRPGALRALGLVMLLPLLTPVHERPAPGHFRLHVLDVGQGLAAVVETRDHVLVYDAGTRLAPGFDMGRLVVVPALTRFGWRRLDGLVLSHLDRDHAGGAASVLERFAAARVLTSGASEDSPPGAESCVAGERWTWDGVRFEFVHPAPGWRGSENDRSCVLRISAGEHAALLSGDIEARAEQALVASGAALDAAILTVPHHGSRTSSSAAFVARVRPRYAVVSAGYLNRFGLPHAQVLARLGAVGARVFDTAAGGALRFDVGPGGVSPPQRWRDSRRRWWRPRP